jgi:hypothetical protein
LNRFLSTIDHPIFFVLFLTLAVLGTKTLLEAGFKSVGWSGPTAVVE